MADETAVAVVNGMTAMLGGTPTATTIVPALQELESAIETGISDPEVITQAVDDYLDEHPEAMLQDGSVTLPKLNSGMYTLMSVEDVGNLFN